MVDRWTAGIDAARAEVVAIPGLAVIRDALRAKRDAVVADMKEIGEEVCVAEEVGAVVVGVPWVARASTRALAGTGAGAAFAAPVGFGAFAHGEVCRE